MHFFFHWKRVKNIKKLHVFLECLAHVQKYEGSNVVPGWIVAAAVGIGEVAFFLFVFGFVCVRVS